MDNVIEEPMSSGIAILNAENVLVSGNVMKGVAFEEEGYALYVDLNGKVEANCNRVENASTHYASFLGLGWHANKMDVVVNPC